jgi:hypothetical protein
VAVPSATTPTISVLVPPDDATDCTGWWRTCHFFWRQKS